MARSTDKEARIIEQLARGRRARYVKSMPLIIAAARTNMTAPNHMLADACASGAADNETANKAIFIAPCAGKVVRVYANALIYAAMAAGGTATVKAVKSVIGGSDVDLNTAFNVGAASPPTDETAVDGTLSTVSGALDLIDGQLVYAVLALSNHAVSTRSNALCLNVEFVPTDAPYAQDA